MAHWQNQIMNKSLKNKTRYDQLLLNTLRNSRITIIFAFCQVDKLNCWWFIYSYTLIPVILLQTMILFNFQNCEQKIEWCSFMDWPQLLNGSPHGRTIFNFGHRPQGPLAGIYLDGYLYFGPRIYSKKSRLFCVDDCVKSPCK